MNRILTSLLLASTICAAAALGAVAAHAEAQHSSHIDLDEDRAVASAASEASAAYDRFAGFSEAIPAELHDFAEEFIRQPGEE